MIPEALNRWLYRRFMRAHCAHSDLEPIHGDAINQSDGWRLRCRQCGRYIVGGIELAQIRRRGELT